MLHVIAYRVFFPEAKERHVTELAIKQPMDVKILRDASLNFPSFGWMVHQ